MIKFFRKIRQNLLSEGKTGKYLKYAIGEIVLVVIGILIALQINNWNEGKKQRNLEVKTLSELQSAFKEDLKDLNFNLNFHKKGLKACEQLIHAFDQSLHYHDSLDQYFGQYSNITVLVHNTGAYETLKSRGLDIIENDTLRSQITNLHDNFYNYILEIQQSFDYSDLNENKQIMLKHMSDWKFFESAKPINYEQLSQDKEFRNRLKYIMQARQISIHRYQRAIDECADVIINIEKEVDKLKK